MPIFSEDPGAHIKLSAETLQSLSWQSQSLGPRQHPFRVVLAYSKSPANLGSPKLFTDPWGDSCAYRTSGTDVHSPLRVATRDPEPGSADCGVAGGETIVLEAWAW